MEAVGSMSVMGGTSKEDVEIARPHTKLWEGGGWLSRRVLGFFLSKYSGGCVDGRKERGGG